MDRPIYVAVIGAGDAGPPLSDVAEAVGRELGRHGAVVVCGGLGGVMEAACRGAASEGAVTVGILPGTDRSAANPHVSVAIPTGLGEARNALVVNAADAVVAIGGEWGTLSEIALARRAGIPVVGIGTWQLRREGRDVEAVEEATDAETAVAATLAAAARRVRRRR